jgi:acyl carrier protein
MEPQAPAQVIPVSERQDDVAQPSAGRTRRSVAEIEEWLVDYLAEQLQCSPGEVEVTIPFDRFGLSSTTAVFMIGSLEDWLGTRLDPTLPFDYPTISALAEHLARTDS